MTNVLLIILIAILVYDKIPHKPKKSIIDEPHASEKELQRQKALKDEFENMMDYSVQDAIESKKVDE